MRVEAYSQLMQIRPRVQEVEIPGWGATVWIRELTGAQRDKAEKAIIEKSEHRTELLISLSLCDAEGVHMVAEQDCAKLGDLPAAGREQLVEAIARLNGMLPEAEKKT